MSFHFIEPVKRRFTISVPPKAGNTSLKHWLYECGTSREFSGPKNIQNFFIRAKGATLKPDQLGDTLRIAVHRDPRSRLLSYFYGHVRKANPSANLLEFVKTIYDIRRTDYWAERHTRMQSVTLGTDPGFYHIIIPTSCISELPEIVSELVQEKLPRIKNLNIGPRTEWVLTNEEAKLIEAYGAHDIAIGWDGILKKLTF